MVNVELTAGNGAGIGCPLYRGLAIVREEHRMIGMHDDTTGKQTTQSTRREALAIGGGAALAALVAAAAIGGHRVGAQDATPMAGEGLAGKYIGVRMRTFKPEQDIDEAMGLIGEGFVPLVSTIPGFVTYFGSADPATGSAIYIGVYADKAGADESNRRAAEWLSSNGYDFFEGDPTLFEGTIGVAAEG
jgi:hypothetical protein